MSDLCIKNCKIVDVKNGEISSGDIYVEYGAICEKDGKPKETYDAKGAYALPGFIDAHVHIESSLLTPGGFSQITAPHGTTAIIADPHEICNVAGLDGLKFFIEETKNLATKFFFCVPSCVPSAAFCSGESEIDSSDVNKALDFERVVALGEIMDVQKVIDRDKEIMRKIEYAVKKKKVVCGHGPGLRGERLKQYFSAGISDDHENFSADEAKEKMAMGVKIMVRENSAMNTPPEIYRLINGNPDDFLFCTDDEYVSHIMRDGHLDNVLWRAISYGVEPLAAFKCVSYNTAKHFGLGKMGEIKEGNYADIVLVKNLKKPIPFKTFRSGVMCDPKEEPQKFNYPPKIMDSVKCGSVKPWDFFVAVGDTTLKIIAFENSIFTEMTNGPPFNKIVVANRYGKHKIGIGFIDGFEIDDGAIASSVSHDCHNIICVGADDESIAFAVNEVIKMKGGLVTISKKEVLASLPLQVAGLMSQEPSEEVAAKHDECIKAARKLGTKMANPFVTLSFMALEAVPRLKMTDSGLLDVEKARIVR